MNTYLMKLTKNPFQKIMCGKKIIESRLYDEKRQKIKLGDLIEFKCTDNEESVLTKVTGLFIHPSFSDLFSDFPPEHFGGSSNEELLNEIHQFYSPEEEKQYGVVGIRIELEK